MLFPCTVGVFFSLLFMFTPCSGSGLISPVVHEPTLNSSGLVSPVHESVCVSQSLETSVRFYVCVCMFDLCVCMQSATECLDVCEWSSQLFIITLWEVCDDPNEQEKNTTHSGGGCFFPSSPSVCVWLCACVSVCLPLSSQFSPPLSYRSHIFNKIQGPTRFLVHYLEAVLSFNHASWDQGCV